MGKEALRSQCVDGSGASERAGNAGFISSRVSSNLISLVCCIRD